MSNVDVQLEAKAYAIGSFLDIKGALDDIFMEAIKEAKIRHEVPEVPMDWVEDMFAYRNLTISRGDITTEGKLDKGCAQGLICLHFVVCRGK
jgi:hypothetical protein